MEKDRVSSFVKFVGCFAGAVAITCAIIFADKSHNVLSFFAGIIVCILSIASVAFLSDTLSE